MGMQNKPQTFEAVMFFSERGGICKEMLLAEFEAVLDSVVHLPEYADQQLRAAYVLINSRAQIRAAAFFLIDFDEQGAADPGWNIPLRQLTERAGRGPDLGAGPIRMVCRSQCPVAWHQMHLWDPVVSNAQNDIFLLRDAARRNNLGLLLDDDSASLVGARLQVVSEDKWYVSDLQAEQIASNLAVQADKEHRLNTEQLLKEQGARIQALVAEHEKALLKVRGNWEEKCRSLQLEVHQLHETLRVQEEKNQHLEQALVSLREHSLTEQQELRAHYAAELKARMDATIAEHAARFVAGEEELTKADTAMREMQEKIAQLTVQNGMASIHSGQDRLEQLASLGVIFVGYHPGAGHLTIPLAEINHYQANTMAYAAAKCMVPEEHYRAWLNHYQEAACQARLASGETCGMPVQRVDVPAQFVMGESNCCARHQAKNSMRTVG